MTHMDHGDTSPHETYDLRLGGGLPNDWQFRATITVPQSAIVLGISRSSAYEAVRTGQIPSVVIGRRVLVPVVRLMHMLTSADRSA